MRRWRIHFLLLVFVLIISQCHCAGIRTAPNDNPPDDSTNKNPLSATSKPPLPTAATHVHVNPPAPKPDGPLESAEPPKPSVVLNVVNNLGYGWFPLNNDKLCEVDKLDGCTGGLSCLVKKLENEDIPLLSAGNTLVDSMAKHDFFKVMKFEPAVKALNILQTYGQLKALVMGPDVFRYGTGLPNTFPQNVKDVMLACNLKSSDQEEAFKRFVDINGTNSCGIRVIGFANSDKMNQLRPEHITVYDEIDNITSAIASDPKGKRLVVVMGEGTIELGKKISAIEDVDLVIMSGSNETGTAEQILEKVEENGRVKFILSKALLGVAQLKVLLKEDCKIADGTSAQEIKYNEEASTSDKCNIIDKTVKKSINEAISAGVNKSQTYEKDLSVKLVSQLSSESCDKIECTLGSTAADAVARAAAAWNKDFPLDSRAVLLPAGIFKHDPNVNLTGPISQKALMDLLVDDEVFHNVNLTGMQLKEILEKMLTETSVNFPQLSGFHLYADINEDYGQKVDGLHILRNHLLFENIRFVQTDVAEYRVILPLNFLLRNGFEEVDSYPCNVTGVFLSEALASFFESQGFGGFFLPPPLGERISYVLPPTLGRCENLIAITVCYTFLGVITISSVLLLGYKIYSDQTAVHYVR